MGTRYFITPARGPTSFFSWTYYMRRGPRKNRMCHTENVFLARNYNILGVIYKHLTQERIPVSLLAPCTEHYRVIRHSYEDHLCPLNSLAVSDLLLYMDCPEKCTQNPGFRNSSGT